MGKTLVVILIQNIYKSVESAGVFVCLFCRVIINNLFLLLEFEMLHKVVFLWGREGHVNPIYMKNNKYGFVLFPYYEHLSFDQAF
jgi:hypothetical protein